MLLVSVAYGASIKRIRHLNYDETRRTCCRRITIQLDWLYNSMGPNNDKRQML